MQNIASSIKKCIRSTDIFARWGGEEFVVLLPNTDISKAQEIAERLKACIQNSKYGEAENITCSFVLVELRQDEDAESFIQRADKLLYEAKGKGKNIVISDDACSVS